MIAQFDNNAIDSSLGQFPISNAPAQALVSGSDLISGPPRSKESSGLQPFIDWNQNHPNGSDATVQALIARCGERLEAEIHIGRTLASGGVGEIISSSQRPQELQSFKFDSSILEASLAKQSFLMATAVKHNSGVLNSLRQAGDYREVIGFAIRNPMNPLEAVAGVLICLGKTSSESSAVLDALPQLRAELTQWMQIWLASRKAKAKQPWATTWAWLKKYRRAILLGSLVATMAVAIIPAPYWPQRECVVEPSARRFVASPIDGRVQKSLVRPGDLVSEGQVIGQLDDEQLRWELGAAEAELQAVRKHKDSALAHKEGGKLRLAQFEQQQVEIKIQSLQSKLQRLELRSPITGIVLQGEWFRNEGAPVARGDTLFEIAPLNQMTVEVRLKTQDLGEIEVGDKATLRVDSAFGSAWTGTISRIDPRAAIIDEQVCFVADVEVDNIENRLRPGMKGTVRISTGFKSVGWLLLHRPYKWLMKNLAW